jgi:hypothetical protein
VTPFPALDQSWKKPAATLRTQLAHWRLRTSPAAAAEGHWPVLPEQRSQVERLDKTIGQLLDAAEGREGDGPLQTALVRRDGIYATSVIWEFFRSRLAQRDSPDLRAPLLLADDVAFACWAPAMQAAGRTLREPPLASFGVGQSPLLWPRNRAFLTTTLPSPWDLHFQEAIRALPVPVFELPWSQVRFLPAYASIAHEIGHAVDTDLDVGATLDPRFSGMQGPWAAWRSETLADLWGLLGCGAGYAAALAGTLARSPESVEREKVQPSPRKGTHPPARVRMPLLFALAEAVEIELAEVRTAWEGLFGAQGAGSLQGELEGVAGVLTGAWPALGGKRPHEVLPPPTREELQQVTDLVVLGPQGSPDARRVAAGAAWAWLTRTEEYAAVDDDGVLERYVQGRVGGERGPGDGPPGGPFSPSAETDAATVAELLRSLEARLAVQGAP